MAKIIGPGSLNVDVTGYAPHLPVDGETVKGTAIRVSPGGKGNNQMTAAHRAGSEVYIIGHRGSDMMGQIMAAHFAREEGQRTLLFCPILQAHILIQSVALTA